MAQGGMETFLILGGVAVGGYLLYQWYTSQQAATAAAATTVVSPQTINVITPAGGGEPSAAQLQTQLNRLTASPADWNAAYASLTGKGIDTLYGFNFNSVYGATGNNTITAAAFLSMAKATGLSPHITLSGIGQLYRGPVYRYPRAMTYRR